MNESTPVPSVSQKDDNFTFARCFCSLLKYFLNICMWISTKKEENSMSIHIANRNYRRWSKLLPAAKERKMEEVTMKLTQKLYPSWEKNLKTT